MSYKNDWRKIVLAEIKPGVELNTSVWTPMTQYFPITSSNKKIYFADEMDNRINDGQMEAWNSATDLSNWTKSLAGTSTVNREATIKNRGNYSVRFDIDASDNAAYIYQSPTMTAGASYIISLWYRTAAGKTALFRLYDAAGNVRLKSDGTWIADDTQGIVLPTTNGALIQYTLQFNAHASYTNYTLVMGHAAPYGSTAASSSIYFDDVFICPKLTATLTENTYTLAGLLTEIKTAMEVPGAGVYTITEAAGIVTVTSTTLLYLYLTTTTDAIWTTIGFLLTPDSNFALSHVGTTNITNKAYSLSLSFNEIVDIMVNGLLLTKTTTAALVELTPGTWWQDFWNKTIYVYLVDGSDPGEFSSGPVYTNSIVAFFWLGFSNAQFIGADCIDFIPTDCTYPIFYEPWLSENSLDSLSAVLADHFESAMAIQFGGVSFLNNGWWYQFRHTYLWNNKNVRIKVGSLGDAYANFETIFVGKVRNLTISDESASFELVDTRVGSLYSLPTKRYNLTNYPNLNSDAVDVPIPILFGQKTNITPICINTATFIYKISDTIWDGVTFAINSIDAVYKNGVLLTVTTDYSVDLTNGQFTLVANPGDAGITCDAKGIKDAFNLTTGVKTSAYSENVADHLFFIFTVLNKIPVTQMDLASFLELQTMRTQKIALYLDTDIPTMEVNRFFQKSSIYHFLPLLNGNFAAKYYRRIIPAGTMELRNYDFNGFTVTDDAENVFYAVVVKYDKDPTTGIYKTVSSNTPAVDYYYSEKRTFEVETALRDSSEATAVLGFYTALLNMPADKLETEISLIGKNLLPTDKLIISRTIEADSGQITVLSDEIYVILETNKDIVGGKVGIVAQLDSQISIFAIHSDTPHQDSHADHSDTVHGDGAYSDHDDEIAHSDHTDNTHTDTHVDISHIDTPYVDIYYYEDHTDADVVPKHEDYSDGHSDIAHSNVAHSDSHANSSYSDHDDIPYTDEPHEDSTHADHSDTLHTDSHVDISHIDSEV